MSVPGAGPLISTAVAAKAGAEPLRIATDCPRKVEMAEPRSTPVIKRWRTPNNTERPHSSWVIDRRH